MSDANFEAASAHAASDACSGASNQQKVALYGLFKQTKKGDCAGYRPGWTDPVGRAKYDAWAALKATSNTDAKEAYVKLVREIDPAFWSPMSTLVAAVEGNGCRPLRRPLARPVRKTPGREIVRYTNNSVGRSFLGMETERQGASEGQRRLEVESIEQEAPKPSQALVGMREKRRWPTAESISVWPVSFLQRWGWCGGGEDKTSGGGGEGGMGASSSSSSRNLGEGGDVGKGQQQQQQQQRRRLVPLVRWVDAGGMLVATVLLAMLVSALSQGKGFTAAAAAVALAAVGWAELKDHRSSSSSSSSSSFSSGVRFFSAIEAAARSAGALFGLTSSSSDSSSSSSSSHPTATTSAFPSSSSGSSGSSAPVPSSSLPASPVFTPLKRRPSSHRPSSKTDSGASSSSSPSPLVSVAATASSPIGSSPLESSPVERAKERLSDFQGKWWKDLARSESQDAHMSALGVPWLVRVAISRSQQTTEIETDGVSWVETTVNLGGSKVQTLQLDNSPQQRTNPLDFSPVTMASALRVDGCVVTESEYPRLNIKQTLTRRFVPAADAVGATTAAASRRGGRGGGRAAEAEEAERGGKWAVDEYHVVNKMVLGDGTELVARSFFMRNEDEDNDDRLVE